MVGSALVSALALLFELNAAVLNPSVGVEVTFSEADGTIQRWAAEESASTHLELEPRRGGENDEVRRIFIDRSRRYNGLYSFRFTKVADNSVLSAQAVDISAALGELFPVHPGYFRRVDPALLATNPPDFAPEEFDTPAEELVNDGMVETVPGESITIFNQGDTWICDIGGSLLILTLVK